eukprot:208572-Hanusia_phi.AAC.2
MILHLPAARSGQGGCRFATLHRVLLPILLGQQRDAVRVHGNHAATEEGRGRRAERSAGKEEACERRRGREHGASDRQ